MEFIIGGLILILLLYIIGYIFKKKYYKDIDRLEVWKIEVMNRPVLDELSKIKKLNMTGQAEELFEKWRKDWDEIITSSLPDVEEYLFNAEEYIDRYRFKKAKEIQVAIEAHLTETDGKIQALISEIKHLVDCEATSKTEVEELKDIYRNRKKILLAHRLQFGTAEKVLEGKLNELDSQFQQFEELTANGDYLDGKDLAGVIQEKLDDIGYKMDHIPDLLVEIQSQIPSQLHELKEGFKEMIGQGYTLEHINVDKEVDKMEGLLHTYQQQIEMTEIEEVQQGIADIKESIDLLYDLLEEEVRARHVLEERSEHTKDLIRQAEQGNQSLIDEVNTVRTSYHLSQDKLEEQIQLEKVLNILLKRFELFQHKIEKDETAYTLLRDEIMGLETELEQLTTEITSFSEDLQMLRKDELMAREKIQELSKMITQCVKLIAQNHIPGVPADLIALLDDSKESIGNVKAKLEEKPLDISSVQSVLELALIHVEKASDKTQDLVETARLVEKVIQYGNRYRSRYQSVDTALKEAESAFREYRYEDALEQAAASIEQIEPGALKRIQSLLEEQIL